MDSFSLLVNDGAVPPSSSAVSVSGPSSPVSLDEALRRELQLQLPNENATPYNLDDGHLHPMTQLLQTKQSSRKGIPNGQHFEIYSLDDLFPNNISHHFNTNASFRESLRHAIRWDMMFGEGSLYGNTMTEQQKHAELAQQKPMIGLWKEWADSSLSPTPSLVVNGNGNNRIRMKQTTLVLSKYLGGDAPRMQHDVPNGDEFMARIGALCNSTEAPFHWTEVVGVAATQNHRMGDKTKHAWHQDYGCLEDGMGGNNNKHVFLGFPCQDNYHGTGVLPHLIPLQNEHWPTRLETKDGVASQLHKPIFYEGEVPEDHLVRPWYAPGREIIVFRDVDVLHSTPDIQFRSSIMRFG